MSGTNYCNDRPCKPTLLQPLITYRVNAINKTILLKYQVIAYNLNIYASKISVVIKLIYATSAIRFTT